MLTRHRRRKKAAPQRTRPPRWLLLVPALAIAAAFPAFGGREEAAQIPPRPPLLVRVEYGDSLWTIAREHGEPNTDVREIVAAIRRSNDVDPGRLRPGAMLAIPSKYVASQP